MARVMRAFVLASSERYLSTIINLGATAILSRLLTPAEFGIVVIGYAVAALAEGAREVSASNYIVQVHNLDRHALRSVFTINTGLTFAIALALYLLSAPLAQFYKLPELREFLTVFAFAFALGPATGPAAALMARNLAFGRRSAGFTIVAAVNAAATIFFAMHGGSYMSFAWAYVVSNAISVLIFPIILRDRSMFGFSVRDWRIILKFGFYGASTRVLSIIGENASYLIMGRFLSQTGIGLIYRAAMVVTFPDRVLLGAAPSVIFSAFSNNARNEIAVGPSYVRSLELLTAIYWPAVCVIGLLAFPIIQILLGSQWQETVPLVQIMAGAALFGAPVGLSFTVPVALGQFRLTPILAAFHVLVSVSCVLLAAPHGPVAIAWSAWVSTPVNAAAALYLVHRIAHFSMRDLSLKLAASAAVAVGAALGPLAVIAFRGWQFNLSLSAGFIAVILAGLGWLAALATVRHPLLDYVPVLLQRLRSR